MTETPPEIAAATNEEPERPTNADEVVVSAAALFQGRREVVIEHDGVRYRLRLTRRGKLILQK